MSARVEIGSRWYWLGRHWIVESETEREGERAVVLALLKGDGSGRARVRHTRSVRILTRDGHAV